MPFKFKQGDPVFYPGTEEAPNTKGLYTVQHVGTDGLIYRIIDHNLDYTDAFEKELTEVKYALFTRIDHGWPIIIPVHDEKLYNRYLNSNMYTFIIATHIATCAELQTQILKELDQQEQQAQATEDDLDCN